MSLSFDFVFALARYVEEALKDYAENIDKYGVQTIDEKPTGVRPKSSTYMRASAFSTDKCPHLAAAEKFEIVPVKFSDEDKWKFALAHYAAMLAKVAVVKAISSDAAARWDSFGERWSAASEVPVSDNDILSGRADLIINVEVDDVIYSLPVEIKRTDADYYDGVQDYAVWQTIAYMYMLQSSVGYVLTLYSGKKNSYKAWPVVKTTHGWYVYDGMTPTKKFYSDVEFDWLLSEGGQRGREAHDFVELKKRMVARGSTEDELSAMTDQFLSKPGPFSNPVGKPCAASYSLPEEYKRSGPWGSVGDLKPSTGVATGLCPLYAFCYRKTLLEKGYNPYNLPDSLPVEDENGTIVLKARD